VAAALFLKFLADVRSIKKKFAHIPRADPDREENLIFGLASEEVGFHVSHYLTRLVEYSRSVRNIYAMVFETAESDITNASTEQYVCLEF
jgi:hypothetical protein